MWQDNLASQVFCLDGPTFVIVHVHSHDMSDQLGQWRTVQASQRKGTSNDSILVSLGQVSTRDYDFPKEHRRVWTVLARLCLSSLLIACFHPRRSHHVDVVV
jgi:hypothetical protein